MSEIETFCIGDWFFDFIQPNTLTVKQSPADYDTEQKVLDKFVKVLETKEGWQLLLDIIGIYLDGYDAQAKVKVRGKVLKETEKAYLFVAEKNSSLGFDKDCSAVWVPKSRVTLKHGKIIMPQWLFDNKYSSIREDRAEAKLIEILGISVRTATCDCCGKKNVWESHLTKIDSGQLFCPDCLKKLRR